jgi:hypothetical protein
VGKVAILDDDLLAVEREERPVVSAYRQMADHDSAAAPEQDADATAPSAIEDRSATVDHQIVRSDAERTVSGVGEIVVAGFQDDRPGDGETRARFAPAAEPVEDLSPASHGHLVACIGCT